MPRCPPQKWALHEHLGSKLNTSLKQDGLLTAVDFMNCWFTRQRRYKNKGRSSCFSNGSSLVQSVNLENREVGWVHML